MMELAEMLAIKPKEYLKDGFFDDDGELRDDINGLFSLAMAYRCREEGLDPEVLHGIVTRLEGMADKNADTADENPEEALDSATQSELQRIRQEPAVDASVPLSEILDASQPWVVNWKNYAALFLHLQKVLSQLALTRALAVEEAQEE